MTIYIGLDNVLQFTKTDLYDYVYRHFMQDPDSECYGSDYAWPDYFEEYGVDTTLNTLKSKFLDYFPELNEKL